MGVAVSRFLKALQKAGLVDLENQEDASSASTASADDTDAVLEEFRRQRAAESAPAASEPVAVPQALNALPHGDVMADIARSVVDIYAAAQIGASPFPAEKLLKVLDGLKALEPSARKAAVMALDASDDAWSVDDVLLDAQRKTQALDDERQRLQKVAADAQAAAVARVSQSEAGLQDAVARIRQQIAELEGLLQRELTRGAQEKTAIEQDALNLHNACVTERARLDAEILRLAELPRIFSPSSGAAA
ncbi:MAG: hypothetical protein RLZZ618_2037 [Pseudomonadota bacterium]|jgi:hypothetical protein